MLSTKVFEMTFYTSFLFTGYVSRCGSDSDSSSDLDMDPLVATVSHDEKLCPRVRSSSDPEGRKRKNKDRKRHKGDKTWGDIKDGKDDDAEKEKSLLDKGRENIDVDQKVHTEGKLGISSNDLGQQGVKVVQAGGTGGGEEVQVAAEEQPSVSEASDSCRSDSRVLTSPSSDSLDALEEDDLITCSSSIPHTASSRSPLQLHPYTHRHTQSHLLAPPPAHSHPLIKFTAHDTGGEGRRRSGDGADPQLLTISPSSSFHYLPKSSGNPCSDDSSLCFAELSRLVDFLPSPPEASEDDENEEEELRRRRALVKEIDESVRRTGEGVSGEGSFKEHTLTPSPSSLSSHMEFVFNFDHGDARCYYNLCSNITPDSARSLPRHLHHDEGEDCGEVKEERDNGVEVDPIPILQPPPGFGDSSSDDEFFDARDRFTSPEDPTSGVMPRGDFVFSVRMIMFSVIFRPVKHKQFVLLLLPSAGCDRMFHYRAM